VYALKVFNLTNINVNLYKTFIAVYETENETKAGERLHIGQTGVNRNMKELENQLGIKLFNSHSKGSRPTQISHEIYPYIKTSFVEFNNAENMINAFKDIKTGQLRMGCHSYIGEHIILDYVCDFQDAHPLVKVNIISHLSKTALDTMLENHEIDFIIDVVAEFKDTSKLKIQPLGVLENVFYTSKMFLEKHQLAETLTISELSKLPLILYNSRHHSMQALQKVIDLPLQDVSEVTTSELMYSLINKKQNKIGYALVNFLDSICDNKKCDIVKLHIKDLELPKGNLAIITNKRDRNPITTTFMFGLMKYCNDNFPQV
jgi:DNA-binding transcriptional LysR family regulator